MALIPENLPHTIQFNLDDTPNPSFKLNQVGYSNSASIKLVYLSSYLGDGQPVEIANFDTFFVKDAHSKNTVLKGPIKKVTNKDPQGNDKLYVIDISDLKKEGLFYIWVKDLGRSYEFLNGNYVDQTMRR